MDNYNASPFVQLTRRVQLGFVNLYDKLKYQDDTVRIHNEILDNLKLIHESIQTCNQTKTFILNLQQEVNHDPGVFIKDCEKISKKLNIVSDGLQSLSKVYISHKTTIGSVDVFKKSVLESNNEIRKDMEMDAYKKNTDIKHKINLTLVRAFQIPIFIFVTYFSVNLAVKLIGEKDLVMPRGLISIVPSNLERSAQAMAIKKNEATKHSADPKEAKDPKSVTNSVTFEP